MRASSLVKRQMHGDSQLFALFRPGGGLRAQRLRVRDPHGQALACESIDLPGPCGRGNVDPAGKLGGVDPTPDAGDAPGRGGLIARVQDTGLVRVKVVADPSDAWCLGNVHVHEIFQDLGEIQFGAERRHLYVPPAHKRCRDQE